MKTATEERTLLEGLIHYISILFKRRWLIIGVTGGAGLAAVLFSVITLILPPERSPLPNVFAAQAILLVERGAQGNLAATILSSLGIEPGTTTTPAGYDAGAVLIMVLQSRTFLDKVIEEFDFVQRFHLASQVKTRARELMLDKMKVNYDRTTASITISFEDTDPVFARDVTNRTVSLLNEWFAQNMGSTNMQQKQLLEAKVNEVKGEIATLEKRLKQLQNRYGVLTAQDLGTSQASALAELRSQLILKEIDIKNYATVSAIEDPKLQQLREERQNILDLISRFQTGVPDTRDSAAAERNLPEVQRDFNNLAVELDVQQKIYNSLSHQYEVLKLTSEPEQAFQILELAEVPDAKSGPHRTLIVLVAALVGFIGAIGLALFLNGVDQIRKKRKPSQATPKALSQGTP